MGIERSAAGRQGRGHDRSGEGAGAKQGAAPVCTYRLGDTDRSGRSEEGGGRGV